MRCGAAAAAVGGSDGVRSAGGNANGADCGSVVAGGGGGTVVDDDDGAAVAGVPQQR